MPQPGRKGEDHGWLLMQGYDAGRDENFLEVRDAGELDFVARVWTAQHFPLGFHGNFYPSPLPGANETTGLDQAGTGSTE